MTQDGGRTREEPGRVMPKKKKTSPKDPPPTPGLDLLESPSLSTARQIFQIGVPRKKFPEKISG